jgi:hypothetical protein
MISRPAKFWKAIALCCLWLRFGATLRAANELQAGPPSAESWGTAGDYVSLFLTAFGVSGGTQSFTVVLQALRP